VKRTVTLEIAGTKFRLVADADEAHLQDLARAVNERVEKLGGTGKSGASPAHLLALTALGLADDLRTARAQLARLDDMTRSVIGNAITRIDQRISETDE
jgi:cell division protein ZapA (FtsZ GTPase activity inhibitor)